MYKALLTYCRYLSCNSNTFRTNAWSNPVTTFFSAFLLLVVSSACFTNVIPSSVICFSIRLFSVKIDKYQYYHQKSARTVIIAFLMKSLRYIGSITLNTLTGPHGWGKVRLLVRILLHSGMVLGGYDFKFVFLVWILKLES